MENFEFCVPTNILFGKGQIEKLPDVVSGFGKKVLLVYGGGSIKKLGLYDKVKELLSACDRKLFAFSEGIHPRSGIHLYGSGKTDGGWLDRHFIAPDGAVFCAGIDLHERSFGGGGDENGRKTRTDRLSRAGKL